MKHDQLTPSSNSKITHTPHRPLRRETPRLSPLFIYSRFSPPLQLSRGGPAISTHRTRWRVSREGWGRGNRHNTHKAQELSSRGRTVFLCSSSVISSHNKGARLRRVLVEWSPACVEWVGLQWRKHDTLWKQGVSCQAEKRSNKVSDLTFQTTVWLKTTTTLCLGEFSFRETVCYSVFMIPAFSMIKTDSMSTVWE